MRRFASPLIAAALVAATLLTALVDTSVDLVAGQVAEVPVQPALVPAPAPAIDPQPLIDPHPAPIDLPPILDDCDVPNRGPECGGPAYQAPNSANLVPDEITSIDDWRPLVARYFESGDVARALRVMRCESGGDPTAKNPRSTASGLFQHLGSYWVDRADRAGLAGAEIFDPVANIEVAAWLVYDGGGWSHWNPSRHCWA